ncbi:hypothetical protein LTR36_010386 [Oleoguttula mirabilis]|uniref:Major facilitator superfamily (MFS) profile domain-containing protein n=1 Tax=Oleoguttula mirabilis TaxID=1507867 RepID=A0AAV9J4A9_9PEZI|nr:hypothetical protein LTR36_010386 [Oleoguttula mirabilis]
MFAWLVGSSSQPPIFLHLRSSKTFIIITVATAVFTDIFVYGLIVPVLPFALTSRSGINPDSIQTWIAIFLAVYGAALLAASPFCGWLADRSTSRRVPLLFGLLALGGSTVLLCIGSSIAVLAAGRVLQGISAAVVWVVGLALIVDTVGPEGVGQAMGYVGLSMSLAILVAPLLGGVVFAASGYYAVFAMAFGLIVLDIILRLVMIEKKVAVKWLPVEEVDETPKANAGDDKQMAENGDSYTDIKMGHVGSGPPTTQDQIKGPDQPVLPAEEITSENTSRPVKKFTDRLPAVIYLFSSRRILSALWAILVQASLLTAFDTILPLFVRDTFHWNSTGAGLIFLPLVVVSFVGPVIGWLSDKYGPRWFATAGFVIASPFLILLRLVYKNTFDQKVLLCALLALIGVTLTLILTPMMAEITYAVDAKARRHPPGFFGKNGAYAQAYSLFNMAWAGGCLVGPLLAGLVNQRAGWAVTVLILGIGSVVTAIPTAVWTGGSIFKKRRRERIERDLALSTLGAPLQAGTV